LMARAAGVDWATAQALTENELEARLYKPPVPRSSRQLEPDFAVIHQELKRPGVTLMLLWKEYLRGLAAAGQPAYKYTSFCVGGGPEALDAPDVSLGTQYSDWGSLGSH